MFKNIRSALALAVLVAIAISSSVSADQSIVLSKKLSDIATRPTIALDPTTGNIAVAFTVLKANDTSYGRVYVTLLRLKSNGTYKAKKPRMVTPDSGYHARAYIKYIPQAGHFLVVWDTTEPGKNLTKSQILGRVLRSNNLKPLGNVITLVDNGQRNFSPVLYSYDDGTAASPSDGDHDKVVGLAWGKYLLRPLAVGPSSKDLPGAGLRWSFITPLGSNDYETDHEMGLRPGRVVPYGNNFVQLAFVPFGGQVVGRHTYITGELQIVFEGRVTQQGGVLRYDDNWLQTGENYFEPDSEAPAFKYTSDNSGNQSLRLSVSWKLSGNVLYRSFDDNNLKTDREQEFNHQSYIRRPEMIGFDSRLNFTPQQTSPSASAVAAYALLPSKDGNVYRQKVKWNGKPKGKAKKEFSHKNALQTMIARSIYLDESASPAAEPKSNAIVVWQKKLDENNHELRAELIKVKY